MHLTNLDLIFWAVGFLVNATLLVVLYYRGRARRFPFFTALITLLVVKTIVLYLVQNYGAKDTYFKTYWSLNVVSTILQLCVVFEVASHVLRPLHTWAPEVRSPFLRLSGVSVVAAMGLTLLASAPAKTWMQTFANRGNLFAAALMSELFIAVLAVSSRAGYPWKTHVATIAQGMGSYSLITVLIETAHACFGVGREMPAFVALSQVRMAAYLGCVIYWIVSLNREEQPARQMPLEMRKIVLTLESRIEYHLRDLRSRKNW